MERCAIIAMLMKLTEKNSTIVRSLDCRGSGRSETQTLIYLMKRGAIDNIKGCYCCHRSYPFTPLVPGNL